jgi:protein pelota
MISNPEVASQLLETRVIEDVKAFQAFTEMLKNDPDRAYYGYNHVLRADEELAVDTLMVTDTLFKSCDVETRSKYVKLCESVKAHQGKVHIFSSLHVSGEQLTQVTGIAAILRFPMPEEKIMEGEGGGGGGGEDGGDNSDDSDSDDDRLMNPSFQISKPNHHHVHEDHHTNNTGKHPHATAAAADSDSDSGSDDFHRDDNAAESIKDMGL